MDHRIAITLMAAFATGVPFACGGVAKAPSARGRPMRRWVPARARGRRRDRAPDRAPARARGRRARARARRPGPAREQAPGGTKGALLREAPTRARSSWGTEGPRAPATRRRRRIPRRLLGQQQHPGRHGPDGVQVPQSHERQVLRQRGVLELSEHHPERQRDALDRRRSPPTSCPPRPRAAATTGECTSTSAPRARPRAARGAKGRRTTTTSSSSRSATTRHPGPPYWINYDTTRVDAFAIKLALDLHDATGPDYYIGENCPTFAEDRTDTFASFVASVPDVFKPCGQTPTRRTGFPSRAAGAGSTREARTPTTTTASRRRCGPTTGSRFRCRVRTAAASGRIRISPPPSSATSGPRRGRGPPRASWSTGTSGPPCRARASTAQRRPTTTPSGALARHQQQAVRVSLR